MKAGRVTESYVNVIGDVWGSGKSFGFEIKCPMYILYLQKVRFLQETLFPGTIKVVI